MLSRAEVITKFKTHGSKSDAFVRSVCGINEYEVGSQGAWLVGDQGGRYLDFGSFAIFLFGHAPLAFLAALNQQLQRLAGSSRAMLNAGHAEALEALAGIAPPGLSKVMLLNSGADAVEAAIKLAHARTGRSLFAHLEHSFHGKTCGALALTDATVFRGPFAEILHPSLRLPRSSPEKAAALILEHRPAAVFCEAIQGEGGIFELSDAMLQALRAACDEAGSLLVCDEIQCGLGRSGQLWGFAKSGIVPDLMLLGKALGGGIIPVSALLATPAAFAPFDANPFLHTSTFAANPLACRAAATTAKLLGEGTIAARAEHWGRRLQGLLAELVERYPSLFTHASGRGLLLGLHCQSAASAAQFLKHCLQHNLLVTPCLSQPTVIRISPPTVLVEADFAFARQAMLAAAASSNLGG